MLLGWNIVFIMCICLVVLMIWLVSCGLLSMLLDECRYWCWGLLV